jgi:hypothetical protein
VLIPLKKVQGKSGEPEDDSSISNEEPTGRRADKQINKRKTYPDKEVTVVM